MQRVYRNSIPIRISIFGCSGMHITLILTVLIMQRSFSRSVQLTKPINTVSYVGKMVKMECIRSPSELPIDWGYASISSNDFSLIYTVGQITEGVSSRYKIDSNDKKRYDIVIDSVDFFHAGTYRCRPVTEEFNGIWNSARLIVLGERLYFSNYLLHASCFSAIGGLKASHMNYDFFIQYSSLQLKIK